MLQGLECKCFGFFSGKKKKKRKKILFILLSFVSIKSCFIVACIKINYEGNLFSLCIQPAYK